jgi:hypothetical protein
MEVKLHRMCEQVIPICSCGEKAGSWGLEKERFEPNKLMSENTELLSIDMRRTDRYAKGT